VRPSCPETPKPQPPFTPTGADPRNNGPSSFFFGTPKLSVLLRHPWSLHENIRWFSDDVHFPTPVNMKVTGRRVGALTVDEMARSVDVDALTPKTTSGPAVGRTKDGATVILSSMEFPTSGCWEITARMNEAELRFVIDVQQPQTFSGGGLR